MKNLILSGLIFAFSQGVLAECLSVNTPENFVCELGDRKVSFSVPTQKICGNSFWGLLNKTTFLNNVEGPLDTGNGYTFEFDGPLETRMQFDRCSLEESTGV